MAVEGVYSIKGVGTMATGRVERGTIRPGDEIEITAVAIEAQGRFAIREGGKTVGAGVITKILD